METLDRYGVLEYLEKNYGVLHTQSWQWLVEEMDEFINEKKQ